MEGKGGMLNKPLPTPLERRGRQPVTTKGEKTGICKRRRIPQQQIRPQPSSPLPISRRHKQAIKQATPAQQQQQRQQQHSSPGRTKAKPSRAQQRSLPLSVSLCQASVKPLPLLPPSSCRFSHLVVLACLCLHADVSIPSTPPPPSPPPSPSLPFAPPMTLATDLVPVPVGAEERTGLPPERRRPF